MNYVSILYYHKGRKSKEICTHTHSMILLLYRFPGICAQFVRHIYIYIYIYIYYIYIYII